MWKIKQYSKPKIKNPVLIEGLPGMGNVGKIATDFMIDYLEAEKIMDFSSYSFPSIVFVNEDNLTELPVIELYQKNIKNNSFLFLAGDIQPIDEPSSYEFCDKILEIFQKYNGKEIIRLAGIGLHQIPKQPKVYCTGNNKKTIQKYKINGVKTDIYGTVGPIMGISGLLLGLAGRKNIPAVSLLAETFGHPQYLGVSGAKELLSILNKTLKLNLNLNELNLEIKEMEKELKKSKEIEKLTGIKKIQNPKKEVNYIG